MSEHHVIQGKMKQIEDIYVGKEKIKGRQSSENVKGYCMEESVPGAPKNRISIHKKIQN